MPDVRLLVGPYDSGHRGARMSAEEARQVLHLAAAHLPVVSATLASWDPSFDVADRMRDTALRLLEEIARVVAD